MAGRRRASRHRGVVSGPLSRSAGFDDIPKDDEDHFEASRDHILLDGYDRTQDSDDDMDVGLNNREVLGIDKAPSDEDEDSDLEDDEEDGQDDEEAYDDDGYSARQSRKAEKADVVVSSDDDDDLDDDEENEDGEEEMHENDRGWGTNKRAYYNTNDLDAMDSDSEIDEEQARELELKEVKRLQKKSRSVMDDSDFGLGGDDADGELAKSAKDAGREQRRRELDGDIETAAISPKKKQQASNGVSTEPTDESSRRALLAKLQQTSPEAVALAGEYADMLEEFGRVDNLLKTMIAEQPNHASLEVMHVHYQTLATYITTMTFYFHLRASPEFSNDPAKLRTHPVMQRMMRLKQGLSVMEDLGLTFDPQRMPGSNGGLSPDEMDEMHLLSQGSEDDDLGDLDDDELADLVADASSGKENAAPGKAKKNTKKSKKQIEDDEEYVDEKPKQKKKANKPKKKAAKAKKPEPVAPLAAGLADLDDEPTLQIKLKKKGAAGSSANPFAVSANDANVEDATFGELSGLSSIESAERAARKRTLQFHASAIESKALQRSKAAKERQSGDADIPYRDRERSRAGVEATKAAREAKLQQQLNGGTGKDIALDSEDGWGEADEKDWRDVMGQPMASSSSSSRRDDNDDDEAADYYDLVTSSRKRARAEAKEEYDEARNAERFALMEDEELEDGQHRGITRQIEKNKGLTPRRPKTSRNPRVKKRLKYEQAKKKLGSRQAVFKGGQSSLQGGYGGEASGISTHLVKSRKLG